MYIPHIPKDKFKPGLHPTKLFPNYFNKVDFNIFFEKLHETDFEVWKFYSVILFLYSAKTSEYEDDKLIKLISCVERIMSGGEYEHPKDWFMTRKNQELKCLIDNKNTKEIRKNLDNLFDKYLEDYGSGKKLEYFFTKHVSNKDKIKIIKGFPFCEKKGNKHIPGVLKHDNETEIKESLRKISKIIYEIRSDYVHYATFFPLKAREGKGHQLYFSYNKQRYIIIGININTFYNIVEEGIFSYFGLTE